MNIIIFTHIAELSGGSNRSLLSVIEALKDKGDNILLVLPRKKGQMYNEALRLGIQTIFMPYGRSIHKKTKSSIKNFFFKLIIELKIIYSYILTYLYLCKFKNFSPNIIYSNSSSHHCGRILSKRLKIPHVWHIREYIDVNKIQISNVYSRMCNRTDLFITIGNDLCDEFSKYVPKEKLTMISNGLKYENSFIIRENHSGINILLTGRIAPEKGQLEATKAFILLKEQRPDINCKLYFAGKPISKTGMEYKENILSQIEKHGLDNDIIFLGEVTEMRKCRSMMDIELMCSEREPFGRVTVEAMRQGLVVIGTDSGGTKDIITDGINGLLYEPNNIEDLTRKLISVIDDNHLYNSIRDRSIEFCKSNFTELQFDVIANTIHSQVTK